LKSWGVHFIPHPRPKNVTVPPKKMSYRRAIGKRQNKKKLKARKKTDTDPAGNSASEIQVLQSESKKVLAIGEGSSCWGVQLEKGKRGWVGALLSEEEGGTGSKPRLRSWAGELGGNHRPSRNSNH